MEMATPSSTLNQIEQACTAFHTHSDAASRAAAQNVLMKFQESPQAMEHSQYILQHSQQHFAQFHAITTLREVSMRKWTALSGDEKSAIQRFVMEFSIQNLSQLQPYIASQLFRSLAVLRKRCWLDQTEHERDQFLQQIEHLLRMDTHHQIAALKLLVAFVSEFSAEKSTAMNLPLEFHTKTRESLENHGLQRIASLTFQLQQDLLSSKDLSNLDSSEMIILTLVLELCVEILNWQFNTKDHMFWNIKAVSSKRGKLIFPDTSWKSILVRPEIIHTAFNVYTSIRSQPQAKSNVPHLSRQFLIQLSSLSGKIFDSVSEKMQFMSEMFQGTLHVLANPLLDSLQGSASMEAIDAASTEVLDMCQIILRLVTNLQLQNLVQSSSLQSFLHELSALSIKLLQSAEEVLVQNAQRPTSDNIYEDISNCWQLEAFNTLLEAWVVLATDSSIQKLHNLQSPQHSKVPDELLTIQPAVQLISESSAPVFERYVRVQLLIASIEAVSEEEEDEETEAIEEKKEQWESAGVLGRVSASCSIHVLQCALREKFTELRSMHSVQDMTKEMSITLEQLHWLVLMTGFVLGDEESSERPLIPPTIHRVSMEASDAGLGGHSDNLHTLSSQSNDPVVRLIATLVEILDHEYNRLSQNPHNPTISPFLAEQLFLSFTRIFGVYFLPDGGYYAQPLAPSIERAFSVNTTKPVAEIGPEEGRAMVEIFEFLLNVVHTFLSHWPSQPQVVKSICSFLRVASNTHASIVFIQLQQWHKLAHACSNTASSFTFRSCQMGNASLLEQGISRLSTELRASLMEMICRMSNLPEKAAILHRLPDLPKQHFEQIVIPVQTRLQTIIGAPNFASKQYVNDVAVQEETKLLIAMYTGIAEATELGSHRLIISFCLPSLPVMVKLLDVYHANSQICFAILQLFEKMVEMQITYIPSRDAIQMYTACGEVIKTYSKYNLGRVSGARDAEEESFNDILSLLSLLSHLIAKDFIDFSHPSDTSDNVDEATVAVTDVVFFGLNYVIPLMTEKLLQYPTLCKQYFTLISFLVEAYAENLAAVEPKLFDALMKSLSFGIQHVQTQISRYSLQALTELATFHLKQARKGSLGLALHLNHSPELFVHFMKMLFHVVLFEDYRPEIIDSVSNALLPLLLIEKDRFVHLAREFAQNQPPHIQERLMQGFGRLVEWENDSEVLDRRRRLHFRASMKTFVTEARGFLEVK